MKTRQATFVRVLVAVAVVLMFKVTWEVLLGYRQYFPPNFEADFLRGREAYFWGGYRWAFYVHLASGPVSLVLGAALLSERWRSRFPAWHRRLGRIQVANVLLLVAPSGLWMSCYAATGAVAAAGLGSLAVVTATFVVLGWRAAVRRRFADHRRWMQRTFALLCSAIVIRLIGGLATVAQFDAEWVYPFSTWASWLVPLAAYEVFQRSPWRVPAAAHPAT